MVIRLLLIIALVVIFAAIPAISFMKDKVWLRYICYAIAALLMVSTVFMAFMIIIYGQTVEQMDLLIMNFLSGEITTEYMPVIISSGIICFILFTVIISHFTEEVINEPD